MSTIIEMASLLPRRIARRGARATFTSRAFVGVVNAANPADPYTPGYSLVDLFASYKVSDSVVIGANVNNLFDIGYTPALSSPPTVTCTPPGITCNTGLGRTVQLTLKTQF